MASTVIEHRGFTAHTNAIVRVEGYSSWHVTSESGITVARIEISTTRKRREDASGEKAFRFVTRTVIKIDLDIGWQKRVRLADIIVFVGPKTAIRQMIDEIFVETFSRFARQELEALALLAEHISDLERLEAWDPDEARYARNLHGLIWPEWKHEYEDGTPVATASSEEAEA